LENQPIYSVICRKLRGYIEKKKIRDLLIMIFEPKINWCLSANQKPHSYFCGDCTFLWANTATPLSLIFLCWQNCFFSYSLASVRFIFPILTSTYCAIL